ncbi:hypothetical protein GOP47_0007554 [Adiantum capillus-veneris]|uniref:Secreted protein n=1 Tax=Adiantum capillus-veneris TaxID=13818 RepID=A0A9D4V0X9_ADICA|nr:hypothetical protein GOP47_0007554 [Adiantum capillus-veneris]
MRYFAASCLFALLVNSVYAPVYVGIDFAFMAESECMKLSWYLSFLPPIRIRLDCGMRGTMQSDWRH